MNNYSRQREEILGVIKNTKIHPTAEQIYQMTIEHNSKISRSTVYRNINILVENGAIRRITMPNGPDRYDFIDEQHHHVICVSCGRIFDFHYNFDSAKMTELVKKETGIETKFDCVTVNGICEKCKSKNNYLKEDLKDGAKRK